MTLSGVFTTTSLMYMIPDITVQSEMWYTACIGGFWQSFVFNFLKDARQEIAFNIVKRVQEVSSSSITCVITAVSSQASAF